jgi:uncharacterized membrane protein (DUF485 family)
MINDFDRILDECIDRINRGESIDSCLANYPDLAEQLRPLLEIIFKARDTYSFVPSRSTKRAARERFNTALEDLVKRREERQPLFAWLQGWSRVWATAAVVLIIAVIGKMLGIFTIFSVLPQLVGAPYMGYIFDITGSYNLALFTFIFLYVVSAVLVFFARPPYRT